MQKIGDKIVYNTIEEILNPSHTALVLWDVLCAFTKMIFNKEEFSRNLNSVVESARKSNIPIFFTSIQTLSKRFESSAIICTLGKQGFDRLFEQFTAEDMDFTIKPEQDEIVINKHTASIFIDTGFERMLRNAGIITIVFTGIATEFGVESSARDAFNRGFYSVLNIKQKESFDSFFTFSRLLSLRRNVGRYVVCYRRTMVMNKQPLV
jgi:nicotinamidase-related amidase